MYAQQHSNPNSQREREMGNSCSSKSSSSSSSANMNDEQPPCPCPDNKKDVQVAARDRCSSFKVPVQYPRYKKAGYEMMGEWRQDCLFNQYGLPIVAGDLKDQRKADMRTFLRS